MKKGYVCNKYPFLSIGDHVKFEAGLFETEDEGLQRLIEGRDYFGVHVHPRETSEQLLAQTQEELKPKVKLGGRGSRG